MLKTNLITRSLCTAKRWDKVKDKVFLVRNEKDGEKSEQKLWVLKANKTMNKQTILQA